MVIYSCAKKISIYTKIENDWLATHNPDSHNCLKVFELSEGVVSSPNEVVEYGPSDLAIQCKFSFTAENAKNDDHRLNFYP